MFNAYSCACNLDSPKNEWTKKSLNCVLTAYIEYATCRDIISKKEAASIKHAGFYCDNNISIDWSINYNDKNLHFMSAKKLRLSLVKQQSNTNTLINFLDLLCCEEFIKFVKTHINEPIFDCEIAAANEFFKKITPKPQYL